MPCKVVEGVVIRQVPRRSGCSGCVLEWPNGRLAHLRDGKTCSSIIGKEAGAGKHPFSLLGADCRHHIWVPTDEEVPVARKFTVKTNECLRKPTIPNYILNRLQERKEAAQKRALETESRNEWSRLARLEDCLEDYVEKEYSPPLATLYATGGPGPADKPWRPTLYRDTKQEQEDKFAFLKVRQKMTPGKKRKVRGSLQDPAQTVVVVIGRQKYLDDI